MPRQDPADRARYQREWKARNVARSGTRLCACGCGTTIPKKRSDGSPREFALGHKMPYRKPGATYSDPMGYIFEFAPDHPSAASRRGWIRQHRLVWERANGPLPDGLVLHHVNGDRADNRLENLEALTPSDHSKGHQREGWDDQPLPCMNPAHLPIGPRSRLTAEQVAEARRRIAAGETLSAVGTSLGVNHQLISNLWRNKTYRCPICSDGRQADSIQPPTVLESPAVEAPKPQAAVDVPELTAKDWDRRVRHGDHTLPVATRKRIVEQQIGPRPKEEE